MSVSFSRVKRLPYLGCGTEASGTGKTPPLLDFSSYLTLMHQDILVRHTELRHGSVRRSSPLCGLPDEIKVKILRFVLLQPGKIRVVAKVDDTGTELG
jgi:hypothetical protein